MKKPSTYLIFSILLLTINLTSQSDIQTRYDFKYDQNNVLTGIRIWFIIPITKDTVFKIQPQGDYPKRKEIQTIKQTKIIPYLYFNKYRLNLKTSLILFRRDTIYLTGYSNYYSCPYYSKKPLKIKVGVNDSLKLYYDINDFENIIKPYLQGANYNDNIHRAKIEVSYEYPWTTYWTTRYLTINLPRQNNVNPK